MDYKSASIRELYLSGQSILALPFSIRVLLENVLRNQDDFAITKEHLETLLTWNGHPGEREIPFKPARVLMQDFTGVPAVVDLASIRAEVVRRGGDGSKINPAIPVDLVIDHSVQVDFFGTSAALSQNVELEYERNKERYQLLKWAQQGLDNFSVVPPGMGICHQVNLEYLAKVVIERDGWVFPDSLVGTDSHTPMINGLGVLGWGVGGIEAEAALLGQPVYFTCPQVIGLKFTGKLQEGVTATDMVLATTALVRKFGVVGKFVEVFGEGLDSLTVPDRATIANMSPEFGCTVTYFPIDDQTLVYLRRTGRSPEQIRLVEKYARENMLWREDEHLIRYTAVIELELSSVQASVAGPSRSQDKILIQDLHATFGRLIKEQYSRDYIPVSERRENAWLSEGGSGTTFTDSKLSPELPAGKTSVASGRANAVTGILKGILSETAATRSPASLGDTPTTILPNTQVMASSIRTMRIKHDNEEFTLSDGSIVIAAITSCTNTSNPSVMIGAGLVARKAIEKGIQVKPWVKTSLAPGSKVVTEYLRRVNLLADLEALHFHTVGYGCTTCIGNSGPLPAPIAEAVDRSDLVVSAVLSGNRNFEARVHPQVKMNFLASPMLVVAFALAGRIDIDLKTEPLGIDPNGFPVFLHDIWPTQQEINDTMLIAVQEHDYKSTYAVIFDGEEQWQKLDAPTGKNYSWAPDSTYIKEAPFFKNLPEVPEPVKDILNSRVFLKLGDSVTTDHISPAGSFSVNSSAGKYLISQGIDKKMFNSYGSRRGNHEVMIRGTFANVRIKNQIATVEGGVTTHFPSNESLSVYDAATRYAKEKVNLIILAGKEYGSGSSRDWAAKGTILLGVKAVIAESFERIHRSNLVGMGVLPLEYLENENALVLGLQGNETYSVIGLENSLSPGKILQVSVLNNSGEEKTFKVKSRLDSLIEIEYYRNQGILQYVLRDFLSKGIKQTNNDNNH